MLIVSPMEDNIKKKMLHIKDNAPFKVKKKNLPVKEDIQLLIKGDMSKDCRG